MLMQRTNPYWQLVRAAMQRVCMVSLLACGFPAAAQSVGQSPGTENRIMFDRVVAVVNRQAILESDLEDEMQLSVLDPSTNTKERMSAQVALERLISRTLIHQQIQQEYQQATEPKPEEIAARLNEIRTELPACVRADCKSDAGWAAFLKLHDLTPKQVEDYLRNRTEILGFIELRFRQGIRITPEEIETYYQGTLLPQYPSGDKPPPLQQVSSRIEEILLQQRVNVLFDNWLSNLRKQGQIEVLDPALETADAGDGQGATKE
ncbi:peptidylprolyl isomerase [Telmatobacter sp. DSM 110680]|uniref:Peptidylprolyl isomerase n=1 Tax=Telmatobacter sp. DSM 110680 TaxID=3036704 RepID=A0AAU7DH95_9BACT